MIQFSKRIRTPPSFGLLLSKGNHKETKRLKDHLKDLKQLRG